MKFCKDCKHFTEDMPQCHAAGNNYVPDYVTGKKGVSATWWSAQVIRQQPKLCGPEATWFEASLEVA